MMGSVFPACRRGAWWVGSLSHITGDDRHLKNPCDELLQTLTGEQYPTATPSLVLSPHLSPGLATWLPCQPLSVCPF